MLGFSPTGSEPIGANAAVAGTPPASTLVSADLVLSYTVSAYVAAELALAYGVRAFVSKTLSIAYQIEVDENPPMSFTPSAARTVMVNATRRTFTATGDFWSLTDPKKPIGLKDPDATTDFTFDWTEWLTDVQDQIAPNGAVFLVNEGLVEEASTVVGTKCTVFLSGGTISKTALLVCRITTVSVPPRTEDRTVALTIEAR